MLQANLDAMVEWADTWQLPFNERKCKVLHLGRNNEGHQYQMREANLDVVTVEKDPGICVDTDLKFREQASAAVAKANQMLAIICHSFALIDEQMLPLLFKSMVRPDLEYGNLVWATLTEQTRDRWRGSSEEQRA